MRMRRRMMQGRRPLGRQGPRTGFQGRWQAELHEERVRYRLDRLAQEQARLQGWLEMLHERSAADVRRGASPAARQRSNDGEEDGDEEPVFSGRIPPHGSTVSEVLGDDEEAIRDAIIEAFDELVDPDNPAIPKVAELNARLKARGVAPIRRKDAEPVFEEWLAERT
jgi:hypothetical protein